MSTMVRVTDETRVALRYLAEDMNEPMQQVLAKAVEAYRRQRILEQTNVAYAALRSDRQAWQEILDERAEWDVTLTDGLEGDDYPLDEDTADAAAES
jgi:predicted transcriptional regulator